MIETSLDTVAHVVTGSERITYHNNSPDVLRYLWVQLDQNVRAKDSKSPLRDGDGVPLAYRTSSFAGEYFTEPFDGGFNIEYVKDAQGKPIPFTVNQTMMRVNIPEPLKSGENLSFSMQRGTGFLDGKDGVAADVGIDIVQVIQALIIMFIAAPALIKAIYRVRAETEAAQLTSGWAT